MSTEPKQITYPRRYYVRRAELVYWLEGFEYKPGRWGWILAISK